MLNIAILITCHNRRDKTLLCLTKLFNQQKINEYNCQVYLVDDGSTDGTGSSVREAFPAVNIINGDGNLYWNRGMYTAWKEAEKIEHNYYLWLNDDTYLFADAIEQLVQSAKLTNDEAIICGNTCSEFDFQKTTYGGMNFKKGFLKPNGEIQKCDCFVGNCVLIPEKVFIKIGTLDPFFHHAIGDIDYALRAKSKHVDLYVSAKHAGTCETHEAFPKWCLTTVPFKERIKNLYSPLGNSHPYYYFKFALRHYGLLKAIKHFFSIHLRVAIPSLWKM